MALNADHIKWFRDSSPYIDAHRGKTFVVCLTGAALNSGNLDNIISDLALLNSLGVRLVITFGFPGEDAPGREEPTVIDQETIRSMTMEAGAITTNLSARFSYCVPDLPGRRREITTTTGNFLMARPIGVLEGTDYQQYGEVRSSKSLAINHQLDGGAIVMLPPLGYSPSGEVFYLSPESVARETACALKADKLIFMIQETGIFDDDGQLISEIDLSHYDTTYQGKKSEAASLIRHCDHACKHEVSRCHLISYNTDGAILEELFTRDGCGTQVVGHSYEQIRGATTEDVPGILRLIEPLENAAVLVKRSRELIESEIDRFLVIERDGLLISCAALYQFGDAGELACLVTHPDYRNGDRGDRLLERIERASREQGLRCLFVLTTQSEHWFQDRGFKTTSIDDLPADRKHFYNYQRNSKVLIKSL